MYEKLYEYQKKGVDFALARKGWCLFCDPRTGKTFMTIAIFEKLAEELADDGNLFEGVVVAPLSTVKPTWLRWFKELWPDCTATSSMNDFEAAPHPKVLIVNYEGVPAIIKRLKRRKLSIVVYDESQKLKARNSKQSRMSKRLTFAPRRGILSGTPIEQAPLDMWAQFRFALPEVFGTRWADFAEEYGETYGFKGHKIRMREDKLPKFLAAIEPHAYRVTQEQAGVLRAEVIDVPVRLLGEQRRIYEDMENESVVRVGNSRTMAPLRITQIVKLQQIACGFLIDDHGRVHRTGSAKLRKLCALVKRVDPPFVIFYKYRHDALAIEEALAPGGYRIARLSAPGARSRRHRKGVLDAFARGRLDVLLCQVRSGGVGLDLYHADVGFIYSTTHSFLDFDQMKARLDHKERRVPARLFFIYARGTVDEDIRDAICTKRTVAQVVLDRLTGGQH